MILLDTNVLSAFMRREPDDRVLRWLDRQPRMSVWTSSITVFEIRFGLETMVSGKKRSDLVSAFEKLISMMIEGRIATFDAAAAERAAELHAARQRSGHSGELRDTMIAGIALSSHAVLATRNVKHFDDIGLVLINPWEV